MQTHKQIKSKIKDGKLPPVVVGKKGSTSVEPAHDDSQKSTLTFGKYDHEVKFTEIVPKISIVSTKGDAPEMGVLCGAILGDVPLSVVRNDAGATTHAMKKRCDNLPRPFDMTSFKRGHSLLMEKINKREVLRLDQARMGEYFAKLSPEKVARLTGALGKDEQWFDGENKHVFAKNEALLKEPGSAPRVVYQGTDMYNALTGCVVDELAARMTAELSLRNPLNTGNKVLFAPGMSKEELWSAVHQAPGEVVESDMKNNDGTQPSECRKYEAMFYKKLGAPIWFVKEFAKNTSVKVWTRFGISAELHGQRWSGESTTTTGNSYVSMCIMLAALEHAEVTESLNVHGGDDYLGVVQNPAKAEVVRANIGKVAGDVGMTAEVQPKKDRRHATFYRTRAVPSVAGVKPVPQFGRVLAKINVRPNLNSNVGDREYMAGKYLSAAYEHRYVPVVKDLLQKTAQQLSDKPVLDRDQTRRTGLTVEQIELKLKAVQPLPVEHMTDFLLGVYDVTLDELVQEYKFMCDSVIDYCQGWAVVEHNPKNLKGNKLKRKPGYVAPLHRGPTVDKLIALDC